MLSARQEEILRWLEGSPFLKTKELCDALKLTRARLNQLIVPLVRRGLVKKEGKARATVYKLTDKRDINQVRRENWELRRKVAELEKALGDRKIIERAKEILIAQFGILPTEAYRKLQEQSMESNRPIAEIARSILDAYEIV